ncbi:kelch repeat and BTB domain-containing protein 12-like [Paramacrobiotus metropolitanus]|uniref:kelch repeat and BTB domain-containing protein 12-like n=1 Tax=Paramacrobiotus metropolitanus TaxID=2943436 RepID=UPI0024457231|nr:kelch repeat and BTB domain-containing protein 12-like [Paramacrobiotus metropolitanus]
MTLQKLPQQNAAGLNDQQANIRELENLFDNEEQESSTRIAAPIADFRRELQNLRARRYLCDVLLKGTEDGSFGIPCHRSILSAHSEYFRTMFLSGMKEARQEVIQLHNISRDILSKLVEYCYMADIPINGSNVQPMFIAAKFLNMTPVVDACWEYMEDHIDVRTCLTLYCFADSVAHKNSALAVKAKSLALKHFVALSQGAEFLEMPKYTVQCILHIDCL